MNEMTETNPSPTTPEPRQRQREGIRETIESIVIALILAFVFRAFVVEAFVIPTGSMAPTLYGAHGTLVCENCGTEFAYGLKDLEDPRNMALVGNSTPATCPNCGHININLKYNDERRNPESGDRILVHKWPFDLDIGSLGPHRWDVTVFKDPADGVTNFIKRLVGMPNEVLMIVDGDVYTVPVAELTEATRSELEAIRHEKYLFQIGQVAGRLRGPSASVRDELDQKLRVARKTPEAQRVLWQLVYDQDFPPREVNAGQPYWHPARGEASGWDAKSPKVEFVDRAVPDDAITLMGKPIVAMNAYNLHRQGMTLPGVSDQRVRFVLTPQSSVGEVKIRMEKHGRVFWFIIGLDGSLRLLESRDIPTADSKALVTAQTDKLRVGKPLEVAVENVDYRLAMLIDGEEVITTSPDKMAGNYYGPDIKALRALRHGAPAVGPQIFGGGGAFTLTHLAVDRDIHYYHDPAYQALSVPWGPASGWGAADSPMLLRGHEYFMLGDNTSASKDSRLWDSWGEHLRARGEEFQLGTVPRDQLIGKAFFVYWPSMQRPEWLPNLPFGILPDIGRMRWIR